MLSSKNYFQYIRMKDFYNIYVLFVEICREFYTPILIKFKILFRKLYSTWLRGFPSNFFKLYMYTQFNPLPTVGTYEYH